MTTLNEAVQQIAELAEKKGWGWDPATKIYYGMIELAEGGDIWKHRDDKDYLESLDILCEDDMLEAIAFEFIDTIIYCMHGLSCIGINNLEGFFQQKMRINKERNRVYADDMK